MSKQPSTRIVIADDHPLFRGALRQAVSHAIDGADVSEVGSLEALTEALATGGDADLVLLDGNPLSDISNTKRVNAVILRGKLFDRRALDGLVRSIHPDHSRR